MTTSNLQVRKSFNATIETIQIDARLACRVNVIFETNEKLNKKYFSDKSNAMQRCRKSVRAYIRSKSVDNTANLARRADILLTNRVAVITENNRKIKANVLTYRIIDVAKAEREAQAYAKTAKAKAKAEVVKVDKLTLSQERELEAQAKIKDAVKRDK